MIEAPELSQRYGDRTAVDGVSRTIAPGPVTGFLGPERRRQPTTLRMIMGLNRPTSGSVIVTVKPCAAHRCPLSEARALLDTKGGETPWPPLRPGVVPAR